MSPTETRHSPPKWLTLYMRGGLRWSAQDVHITSGEKKRVRFRAPHRLIDRTDVLAAVLGEDRTGVQFVAEGALRETPRYERAAVTTDVLLGEDRILERTGRLPPSSATTPETRTRSRSRKPSAR